MGQICATCITRKKNRDDTVDAPEGEKNGSDLTNEDNGQTTPQSQEHGDSVAKRIDDEPVEDKDKDDKDNGQTPANKQTTTKKHADFVAEPMGDKSVKALAGVGDAIGERLTVKGFDKAYVVLGKFLLLKKDEEKFLDWMKEEAGANKKQASDCLSCLQEWCQANL